MSLILVALVGLFVGAMVGVDVGRTHGRRELAKRRRATYAGVRLVPGAVVDVTGWPDLRGRWDVADVYDDGRVGLRSHGDPAGRYRILPPEGFAVHVVREAPRGPRPTTPSTHDRHHDDHGGPDHDRPCHQN